MGYGDDRAYSAESRTRKIRELAFRHGVPECKMQELVAAHTTTDCTAVCGQTGVDPWTSGLLKVEKSLQFGGSAAWAQRVKHASGAEALFDQDFRFVAVSREGRTVTAADGTKTEFAESVFLGMRYVDLLPERASLLNDGREGFDGLYDLGFFKGRMLGAQIHLSMNFGFHFLSCVMELWAVHTPDKGILAHSRILPLDAENPVASAQGVRVFSVHYH